MRYGSCIGCSKDCKQQPVLTPEDNCKNFSHSSLYIVEVVDDGEKFIYEYGNLKHAEEHYNNEKCANLYEYNKGNHYFIKGKLV